MSNLITTRWKKINIWRGNFGTEALCVKSWAKEVFKTKLMAFLKNTKLIFRCHKKWKRRQKTFHVSFFSHLKSVSRQIISSAEEIPTTREALEHKQKFPFFSSFSSVADLYASSSLYELPLSTEYSVRWRQIWLRDYVSCMLANV